MKQQSAGAKKQPVFVGIDVAFAKRKRLPICVCISKNGQLKPLPLKTEFCKPPAGRGNRAALSESERMSFAAEVVNWLSQLESEQFLRIERIAIDAPSNYAIGGRRVCEQALDKQGISCFATPSKAEFDEKIKKAAQHLADGGKEAELPSANQLWMLAGFSLFRALEKRYECIEVFPQAIVKKIGCNLAHKSTAAGFDEQIKKFSLQIGQSETEIRASLKTLGFGGQDDRLDAWLSVWVASLPESRRIAYGTLPDDAIWIPL